LPAAHVDRGRALTESVVREIAEELGITLAADDLRPSGTMFRWAGEPRVDIFFAAQSWQGTPEIREPWKCSELVWADPDALPGDGHPIMTDAAGIRLCVGPDVNVTGVPRRSATAPLPAERGRQCPSGRARPG
jgi:8-oxo-dGTP pyrophosphatase MutT (NUDIX family)